MKIKKFESIEFDLTNYTPEIEEKIKKFEADKIIIKYYVSTTDDKEPFSRHVMDNFEEAFYKMIKINKIYPHQYCIYESRTKALTKEEIETYLISKKYNL